jgi:hypothetical protein
MITDSEVQQPRSPSDLREFVVEVDKDVRANESERKRGMQKKGLYKQFLEELIPISRFAVWAYPDNYKVKPVLGNQGYDALVFSETGEEVDRIEITNPRDGAAEAKDVRLVMDRGYGECYVGIPGEEFDALSPHVLAACRKKAQKDYGDCTLVFSIAPEPRFQSFEALYEKKIEALVRDMAQIRYKAKRVFLIVLPDKVVDVTG